MTFVAYGRGIFHHFLGSCHFEGALILVLHISAELFDFEFSEDGRKVIKCPGGHEPKSCSYNQGLWFDFDDTVFLLTRLNILG